MNFEIRKEDLRMKLVKLVLGVSMENGIEAYHITDGKLDSDAFIQFLRKLKLVRRSSICEKWISRMITNRASRRGSRSPSL